MDAVKEQVWFHTFELLPGLWTPGKSGRINPGPILDAHGIPKDLTGKKALDVGTLDGPYAFELERRGAEVVGLDIQRPGVTGFEVAKKIIGSQAKYVQGDVYSLTDLFEPESFDVVLFFGVWYHMKSPINAFEQINTILKKSGILAAEGECLLNHMSYPGDAKELAQSPIPLSIFYPDGYKGDKWNWVVPNPACVTAWLTGTGFVQTYSSFEDTHPHQRMRVSASKVDAPRIDNPIW